MKLDETMTDEIVLQVILGQAKSSWLNKLYNFVMN